MRTLARVNAVNKRSKVLSAFFAHQRSCFFWVLPPAALWEGHPAPKRIHIHICKGGVLVNKCYNLKTALFIKKYHLHYTAEVVRAVASAKETVTQVELSQHAAQAPRVGGRAAPFAKEHLRRRIVQSVDEGLVCGGGRGKEKNRTFANNSTRNMSRCCT